jgi:hypothetical protein
MSPSMRDTPRAPPGCRSGSGAGGLPTEPAPVTGVKPSPANRPRAHSNVEGSNPEKTSGRLSGRRDCDDRGEGSWAPAAHPARGTALIGRWRAATNEARSSGAAIAPGPGPIVAVRKRAEADRGASVLVSSIISAIGVMPAMVSLEKGKP